MSLQRALLRTTLLAGMATIVSAQSLPPGFTYQTLVAGGSGSLNSATAMAFLPDGRLLLTERATGNIRQFRDGALVAAPWATIAVASGGSYAEQGLLGIAVDPAFLTNRYIYIFYTDASGTQDHIARLQELNGVGTNLTVLSPNNSIPSQLYHNAGAMVFGADGSLFVATGDALGGSNAQDPVSWLGKTLRFQVPNLTIPANNPTPGSPVYSLGHRNHFGLTIHPVTGRLYQTENGGALMDEVNLITPGGNYGWPLVEGHSASPNPNFVEPLVWYQPTVAPTGCCFYSGNHYPPQYRNACFFTDYNMGRIRALTLNAAGQLVISQTTFDTRPGSGYAIAMGPDGNLWCLTNPSGGFGANELGRYVHINEASPSVHIASVSNKSLGASATVCVHAWNGSIAVPWLSLSRFATPLPTAIGNLWVQADAFLPVVGVYNDHRIYLSLEVPNSPAFVGASIHTQALVITPQWQPILTDAAELVLRG